MALTERQVQDLILKEYDVERNSDIKRLVPLWWDSSEGDADGLRQLKLRESILSYLLGKAREDVDNSQGEDSVKANQRFNNTLKMLDRVTTQITNYQSTGTGSGSFATQLPKNAAYG